ncbi:MAG: O-antigen ligase family protein [Candidatus Pacebacteria bacterium]|nr:O-antigen ligase family protein [Candidatus Paceibacterota bacterium]
MKFLKRVMSLLPTCGIAFIAFLIPTNLFLKYVYDGAFVNGTLVDYLLPKFYLSDIPIMILLALWIPKISSSAKKLMFLFVAFAGVHLLFLTNNVEAQYSMLSTVWFLAKLGEMLWFSLWCVGHASHQWFRKGIVIGLCLAIGVQVAVGTYQYVEQRSFLGYRFLGEPLLEQSPMIAKSKSVGEVRILAYGTTPHPNVLAGFTSLSTLLIFSLINREKIKHKKILIFFLGTTLALVLFITQSLSALFGLIFGVITLVFTSHTKQQSHKKMSLLVVLGVSILVLMPIVLFGIRYMQQIKIYDDQNTSVLRRTQLQTIATRAFLQSPLTGIGLNQFTTRVEEFGMVSATTRFLQPVHNVLLLWLAETGILGILFLILFIYFGNRYYSLNFSYISVFFIPLSIILSLDHYLFMLQHGQLLSAILIGFLIIKKIHR